MTAGYDEFRKWLASPTGDHVVAFYDDDTSLVLSVCDFLRAGSEAGETCIVIARSSIITKLYREYSSAPGISHTLSNDKHLVFRAEAILDDFMVNEMPDRKKFFKTIKALIDEAGSKGKPVRAYGDMVALLWEEGNHDGAMALEALWNEAVQKYNFSRYCAYPHHDFIDHEAHAQITAAHHISTHALVA
jgi:hypothetical protein